MRFGKNILGTCRISKRVSRSTFHTFYHLFCWLPWHFWAFDTEFRCFFCSVVTEWGGSEIFAWSGSFDEWLKWKSHYISISCDSAQSGGAFTDLWLNSHSHISS